jgi:3-phosphoshikimate 1-carboxyvinyltransferase
VHVEDIGTTRKTLPDFVGLWQGMLDRSRPVVRAR